jgi:hypothetical protein
MLCPKAAKTGEIYFLLKYFLFFKFNVSESKRERKEREVG